MWNSFRLTAVEIRQVDRLRIPIRRSDLHRLLKAEGELTDEERRIRERFAGERALDLGIPHMERYGQMYAALVRAPFGRRFERALWHPEEIVGRRWPLNARELAQLLGSLGEAMSCSHQTIDRLARSELIAPPLLIGQGEARPLRVYFGRHFVEVAYWQQHGFRPSEERARLAAFRSVFDRARQIFWGGHPSVTRQVSDRRTSR